MGILDFHGVAVDHACDSDSDGDRLAVDGVGREDLGQFGVGFFRCRRFVNGTPGIFAEHNQQDNADRSSQLGSSHNTMSAVDGINQSVGSILKPNINQY